jgi:hypothetical protein
MTTACGYHAARCQERLSRQNCSSRRQIQGVGARVIGFIARAQRVSLYVFKNLGPELYAVTDGNRVGILAGLIRAGQYMQAAEHDAAALPAIPVSQLIGAPGKRQMDGDTYDLWQRITRRCTLK